MLIFLAPLGSHFKDCSRESIDHTFMVCIHIGRQGSGEGCYEWSLVDDLIGELDRLIFSYLFDFLMDDTLSTCPQQLELQANVS